MTERPTTGRNASATSLVDVLNRAGLLDPRRVPALLASIGRWGPTTAAPYTASAVATPTSPAIIDDRGTVSWFRLDRDSSALAAGMHRLGLRRGEHIAVACHNHREFVEATIAAAKAGLGVVFMNTSFGARQMNNVLARESVTGLIVDADLAELVDVDAFGGPVVLADLDRAPDRGAKALGHACVTAIHNVRDGSLWRLPLRASLPVPPILLTSGTTGTPKGARRSSGSADASAATGILERIPYRHDDVVAITSPLFHAWGLAQMVLAATLGATVSLTTTFDADATLDRIERDGVTVLAVVPAILQRWLAPPHFDDTDLSGLGIVAPSGSA
ncbi:MAG: AMP-binding protein, partial [Ilumatobacter sp.]